MAKVAAKEGFLTIKEATAYAGFSHDIYTRQLLSSGKFDTPTPPVKIPHFGYSRWEIAKASIDFYLKNKAQRTSGRRFILKINLSVEEAVREALDKAGIEYTLSLSYRKKGRKVKVLSGLEGKDKK